MLAKGREGRYNEVLWASCERSHSICQPTARLCTDGGMMGNARFIFRSESERCKHFNTVLIDSIFNNTFFFTCQKVEKKNPKTIKIFKTNFTSSAKNDPEQPADNTDVYFIFYFSVNLSK